MKAEKPMSEVWPDGSVSYRLGVIENVCEIHAIIHDGQFIGSDMKELDSGIVVSAERDKNLPHDQCVRQLCDGMLSCANEERYELAAVVRNLLKILGIDPSSLK